MADVVLVGVNLFFASKLFEPAKALGLSTGTADDLAPEKLAGAKLVLVDLERVPAERVKLLRGLTKAHLVGFGSHGATDVLEAAEQAGCDEVLSRGQLSAQVPRLLERLKG